jgi:hypothetical protein
LSRRNIPATAAFSSVVLENIFYSISVAIMVVLGTVAFLLGYRPTDAALTITVVLATVAVAAVAAVWWLLSSQPRLLRRFLTHSAVVEAEDRVFRFAAAGKAKVGEILLLEFAFHISAVLEIAFSSWCSSAITVKRCSTAHPRHRGTPDHDRLQRAPAPWRGSHRRGLDDRQPRTWAGHRDFNRDGAHGAKPVLGSRRDADADGRQNDTPDWGLGIRERRNHRGHRMHRRGSFP